MYVEKYSVNIIKVNNSQIRFYILHLYCIDVYFINENVLLTCGMIQYVFGGPWHQKSLKTLFV